MGAALPSSKIQRRAFRRPSLRPVLLKSSLTSPVQHCVAQRATEWLNHVQKWFWKGTASAVPQAARYLCGFSRRGDAPIDPEIVLETKWFWKGTASAVPQAALSATPGQLVLLARPQTLWERFIDMLG